MTDKQIKVLMIEDNPGDILLISEMFKEVDISLFDLETASCLKEGLGKIKETLYDVILLDLGLPDSRGLETFIKVNVQEQEVPIIVLTGLADEALALDAIKKGAQDYLVKEQSNTSRLVTSISYAIERKKTERRLVKSEQWFRMLIETSPEVVTATDMEGRITYVSPRTLELHGFKSSEELIGKSALNLISPEDHERAMKNLQATLRDGILKNEEYILVRKDGSRFIGELSSTLVHDIEGEPKGFVAITRDITERRRAEEAIQKRNAQLELIHHIQSEIPVNTDIETVIVQAAESIGKSFGYYKISVNLYHPETKEIEYLTGWNKSGFLIPRGHRQKLGQGLIGKAGLLKQTIVANDVSKEPDYIPNHLTETKAELIIPLVVQDQLIGVLDLQATQVSAFSEDDVSVLQAIASYIAHIIDEKKREEELGKEKDKAQNYLDIAGVMIVILDSSATVTLINKKGCKILGYPEHEIIGKNWFEAFLPARIKDEVQDVIKRLMAGEVEPVEYHENPVLTQQGEERIIAWHNIPLKDEAGNFVGVLCSGEDITERRRAEEMLQERESKLKALFEILPIGVSILDTEQKISFANSALERILEISREGLFREDYKNRTYLRADGTLMPAEEFASARAIKEQRAIHNVETGVVKEDGKVIWTSVSAVPVKLPDWNVVIVTADITERKQAEKEVRLNEARLQSLLNISQHKSKDIQDLFDCTLHEAIKLTSSKIGFFGFYSEENRAMTIVTWSREAMKECEVPEKSLVFPLENAGIWAEGIRRRTPFMINDYQAPNPNNKGCPTGHVKLSRYLTIPLFSDDNITAVVGVANKEEDYDESDVRQLTLLMDPVLKLIEGVRAEEELKKSEERFRLVFESAPDAYYLNDLKGNFIDGNKAAEKLTGYKREELVGMSFLKLNLLSAEFIPKAAYLLFKNLRNKSTGPDEFILKRKDGSKVTVEISTHPVKFQGKTVVLGIARDITERKKAEQALKENEEKYRTLTENVNIGVYRNTAGAEGRFLEANSAMVKMFGYKNKKEFLALAVSDLYQNEAAREKFSEKMLRQGFARNEETHLKKKDGSPIVCSVSAVAVKDEQGSIQYFDGTIEDITERKRAEEELDKYREHLEELVEARTKELDAARQAADAANRAKSVFLANMSHEIRTPMNAILGFSQLMQRDDTLNPQQWKHLDIINRSGEHLIALINDILEMSKIEAGRTTLNPTIFNLRALLEDLEMMFRVRTDAKKLNFSVEGLGHMPGYVVGDQGKLLQVFINLLGNAVKFTEKGGVVLRVRVKQEDSDRLRLLAEVEDTGPGIPETELNNLFKPFLQTQNSRRAGSGTGLGLAISKEFVRLMGGDIMVGSKDGTGSLFKFDVRLKESETGPNEKKQELARVRGLRPGQPEYRILIADDEETNLALLSRLLGDIGFEMRQATNGEEAVETFRAWQPHLIFMDMRMPVMDGYDAIRRIRADAGGRDVKIVSVSASAFEQDRREALRAGADEFIAKPFREAVLFEKIGKLLGVEYSLSDKARSEKLLPNDAVMSAMTAEVLSALPEESIHKMRDAVIKADFELMMELVGGVEDHNIFVAQELRSLIERFEYTEFLELLQTGRNSR